jgi:hypothetical protein
VLFAPDSSFFFSITHRLFLCFWVRHSGGAAGR